MFPLRRIHRPIHRPGLTSARLAFQVRRMHGVTVSTCEGFFGHANGFM